MSGANNVLEFKIDGSSVQGRNVSLPCEANVGDTRVKHAGDLTEIRLLVCEHHLMVLESIFGLRLRALKRTKNKKK